MSVAIVVELHVCSSNRCVSLANACTRQPSVIAKQVFRDADTECQDFAVFDAANGLRFIAGLASREDKPHRRARSRRLATAEAIAGQSGTEVPEGTRDLVARRDGSLKRIDDPADVFIIDDQRRQKLDR